MTTYCNLMIVFTYFNYYFSVIIADISGQVGNNSNFVLQKHHLDFFLNNYFGNTKQPCLIVFKFGWLKYASSDDINISPRPG